jgi:hypothetical protein
MTYRNSLGFATVVTMLFLARAGISEMKAAQASPQAQQPAQRERPPLPGPARVRTPVSGASATALKGMEAPPVLWMEREIVQNGKMREHNEVVRKILDQYEQHHTVFRVLGLTGLLPDSNEVMFLIHFQSFAEIDDFEKQFAAGPSDFVKTIQDLESQESALHASKQSLLAVFRPDLSYRADGGAVARARLVRIDQFIVPLGHVPDYESDVSFLKEAYARADIDEHYFVYQTVAGAESQTMIVLRPLKSMADWDKARETDERIAGVLDAAGKKRLARIWKDTALQGMGQSVDRLYLLRPDLSQTSDQFAGFDPGFWRPKK